MFRKLGKLPKKVEYPKNDKKLSPVTVKKEVLDKNISEEDYEGLEGLKQRFFTDYDLWDPNQNDSTPCIGASGKDLCEMTKNWINTIALVNIKREELWISFWDKVKLIWWPCDWVYSVEDEMNWRFRQSSPVYRPWTNYEIRWDIARFNSDIKCQWAYRIKKV